ncbi:tRNA 5-hydroxyuridine modification protein YegQ [Teredinibacter sp. KSP-S5-2]|uniref:prephenate-dependent tRNA uridine(34) hydroxylase TrhP n=1 Tax=Teredinibacter sp. KSP-S5-2 TaxID=3034506 RepID=UPI0029346FFB|nr:tRNA 5-hydroxyuridine modification protein YegQ [Teredinibacter sp. KSP-S5-2]WNO07586.1 tRNA 5-hydroxyuridine modification protein YegQ [Teredinibacter sp. KSP-S5-2]
MATELLSPAGTLKSMRYAFAYGANAVYAGQPRYSLRVRNNEFNKIENLAAAIEEAHQQDKLFYLASNISPHNDKVRSYLRDLEPVIEMKPDALIMSDPGLIMMVREKWPEQPVHLSVQANAVNYATVKFWANQGIERVILSRELSLDEIEEIRQQCPDTELEVFVHGALCIAYSGRCLLSGYMTHRDSNQGACTNSCRWEYNSHEAKENDFGDLIAVDSSPAQNWDPENEVQPVLLQERNRPGEYMPAYEDEHGTYIMNSKDLRAVQHVERLVKMGVQSLKIEGRTKSHYYVARTAQVYRRAIDAAEAGIPFDMKLMRELEHLANRGYTEGFYRRHVPSEYQNYDNGVSSNKAQQFVGEVIDYDEQSGWLSLEVKNRFEIGDDLELITPTGNMPFSLDTLETLKGQKIEIAPGSGHQVRIQLPELDRSILDYAMVMRHI